MQNQIIARPNQEHSIVSTLRTQPQKPQYVALSPDKLKELYEGGEINRSELLNDLPRASDYYTRTVTPAYAIEAYRKLCEEMRGGQAPVEGRAHIYATFAEDAIAEGWTMATIDWVIPKYRRNATTDFAPAFGKLNTMVKEGGFSVPTIVNYQSYQRRIQALLDPNYQMKRHRGQKTAPPEPSVKPLTAEQRAACVAQYNQRKGLLKTIPMTKKSPADLAEATNRTLMKLADRVEIISRANNFHTVVAICGDTRSEIRNFVTAAEAAGYVEANQ